MRIYIFVKARSQPLQNLPAIPTAKHLSSTLISNSQIRKKLLLPYRVIKYHTPSGLCDNVIIMSIDLIDILSEAARLWRQPKTIHAKQLIF
jgi:hypothetical protein